MHHRPQGLTYRETIAAIAEENDLASETSTTDIGQRTTNIGHLGNSPPGTGGVAEGRGGRSGKSYPLLLFRRDCRSERICHRNKYIFGLATTPAPIKRMGHPSSSRRGADFKPPGPNLTLLFPAKPVYIT